jgi:hypothetical protein
VCSNFFILVHLCFWFFYQIGFLTHFSEFRKTWGGEFNYDMFDIL